MGIQRDSKAIAASKRSSDGEVGGRDGVARSAEEGGCEEGTVARTSEIAGLVSPPRLSPFLSRFASPSRVTSPAARIFPPVARRLPTRARGVLHRLGGERAEGGRWPMVDARGEGGGVGADSEHS